MAKTAVNPQMIAVAREASGLTQGQLADRLSVSQAKISKYESGLLSVSENDLINLAKELDVPESFFSQTDKVYGFGSLCFYHRKRQRMPVGQLRCIQAKMNIFRFQVTRFLRGIEISLPNELISLDVDEHGGPEHCARLLRRHWKIPMGPVHGLISTVESAGALVHKMSFGSMHLDAISQIAPDCPPIIFVNADIPMDRLRFTLMHEIGHIVMHRAPSDNMEQHADRFAAEFLLPEAELKPVLRKLSLHRLPALKSQWKASMAAIAKRAFDLGQISERQYRSLFTQMSRNGWRTREPIDLPPEEPTVLTDILRVHVEDHGYTLTELGHLANAAETSLRRYLDSQDRRPGMRVIG